MNYRLSYFAAGVRITRFLVRVLALPLIAIGASGALGKTASSLEAVAKEELKLRWTDQESVSHVFGTMRSPSTKLELDRDPFAAAVKFFENHADSFGLSLGTVPAYELRNSFTNQRGERTVRLTQSYRGIPVFRAWAVVHFSQSGDVEYAIIEFDRHIELASLIPQISRSKVQELAVKRSSSGELGIAGGRVSKTPELVVYPKELNKGTDRDRLAWVLAINGFDKSGPRSTTLVVDATSGETVATAERIYSALYREVWDLQGIRAFPVPNCNQVDWADPDLDEEDPFPLPDPDPDKDELGKIFRGAGDSYHFFADMGWKSFDGKDARVKAGANWFKGVIPFWRNAYFYEGNGDDEDDDYCPPHVGFGVGMGEKDVFTHEFAHGVIHFGSGLLYSEEWGLQAATHEALADTFGVLHDKDDWTMGEDTPRGVIRDIKDPSSVRHRDWGEYPEHVDEYVCENEYARRHFHSTILSHVSYLFVENVRSPPTALTLVGPRQAVANIYLEAVTSCIGPRAGFVDTRNCVLVKAEANEVFVVWPPEPDNDDAEPTQQTNYHDAAEAAFAAVGLDDADGCDPCEDGPHCPVTPE